MMTDYTVKELTQWNKKIEELVDEIGLTCYDQDFELCSYEEMLCYEAYVGMPSHYPHWSYGKTYDRLKSFYKYNLVGLPYEMVINADPCIAYLMRDNSLLLQILTMAHVYGHNDFFKNNRLFKRDTRAELTIEVFKVHANRVREYIQDPSIGSEKVEKILDAAHALRLQTCRNGLPKQLDKKQLAKETQEAVPQRFEEDLLGFLAECGKLSEWERDLVYIVREEALYFMPQIETKIMNEGWASYWHYQLLNQLDLPQSLYLEFLQRHNLVVRPFTGQINPYFVGFKMFEYLDKQPDGRNMIMNIRQAERDQSFIRRYLNRQLCEEMHLFSYGVKNDDLVINEVSDEQGWKKVRDDFAGAAGLGGVPLIKPVGREKGTLILEHVYDGRSLDLKYAEETLKYVVDLWGDKVELKTVIANKTKTLRCNTEKVVATL